MVTSFQDLPLAVSFARAAELVGVSRNTLRRHAKLGRLRTVLLGRRRLIPYDALRDLVRGTVQERV